MVRRSRKHRGGSGTQSSMKTVDITPAPVTESSPLLSGGRKHRRSRHHKRSHRKHRGGSMLATAALPFGLFGLQKFFQKSRVNPIRRMGRSARRTIKRVF